MLMAIAACQGTWVKPGQTRLADLPCCSALLQSRLCAASAQTQPNRADCTIAHLRAPATADTMAEAADAAAAAVLADLPQGSACAAGESMLATPCAPCFPGLSLTRSVASMGGASCCVGILLVAAGSAARVDSSGKQICELCPVRLSRAKGTAHVHGCGHICQRCYDRQRRPARAAAVSAAPPTPATPRKRRAESDPGESRPRTPSPRRMRPTTHRITPPEPAPVQQKQRTTRQDDAITRLLDETHARRMAAQAQQQQ